MKEYEEIEYWNKREYPHSSRLGVPPLGELNDFSFIKKHLGGCDNALDFGPGVGRTFSAYDSLKRLECFDITNKHLPVLKNVAKGYDFKLNFTLGTEVGVTPYGDKEFEAAIASQVLLHQRFDNINKVMLELLRVADKVIVISWRDQLKPDSYSSGGYGGHCLGDHCFNHNYLEICSNNGWLVSDVKYRPINIYFVYSERGV